MAEQRFPVFTAGQTLTKDDLNLLRDFLDGQDRLTGRLVGFGIACGLTGRILSKAALRIDGGLAIDQNGTALALDEAVEIPLNAAPGQTTFDFLDPAPGGVTPVLVLRETDQTAPDCGEEDCAGHAATRVRTPKIVLAAGRLRTGAADFAAEKLLKLDPLTITAGGVVQGDFAALRTAIVDRLAEAEVTLSQESAGRLAALSLPGDLLPAVRAARAAYLNQIFFAVLDLLRSLSLQATPCPRVSGTPGVALGWLVVKGGQVVWDAVHRHDFDPPAGVAAALLGGGRGDPSALFRNRLEALIQSYNEPPDIPPPGGDPLPPPTEGDFPVCPPWHEEAEWAMLVQGIPIECAHPQFPPEALNPDWRDLYVEVDPVFRVPVPDVHPPPLETLYGIDPLDFAGAGVVRLTAALGTEADGARNALANAITGHGVTADVRVVERGSEPPGFTPQGTVSAGDAVILVADEHGKVALTGRIPNQQILKSAGTAVAGALDAASTATEQAAGALTAAEAATSQALELSGRFEGFQTDFSQLQSQFGDALAAVDAATAKADLAVNRVDVAVTKADGAVRFTEDLSASLDRTAGDLGVLRGRVDGGLERLAGVENLGQTLQADMSGVVEQVQRSDGRIDDVFKTQFGRTPGLQGLDAGLVEFLGTMRRSLEQVATTRRRPAVRAELARGDEAFALLAARAAAVHALPAEERAALADLVRSLVGAAAEAGLPDDALTELRRTSDALLDRLA